MKTLIGLAALAAAAATSPLHAQGASGNAKATAEALGQCLVLKTTGADRIALAKWILSAMASVPKLKEVAVIDPAKKDAADRSMAAIFTRLIAVDCTAEAKPLLKLSGRAGFEAAFQTLGSIAMQEVVAGPEAEEAMGSFAKYLDEKAFTALAK